MSNLGGWAEQKDAVYFECCVETLRRQPLLAQIRILQNIQTVTTRQYIFL